MASFGQAMQGSFPCVIDSTKGVSGSGRARGERRCPARVSGPPEITGIGVAPRRYLRASTRNSAAASRCPRGKQKGRKRGESELFKVGRGMLRGLGFGPIDRWLGKSPCRRRRPAGGRG
jgi:hypothetical protein